MNLDRKIITIVKMALVAAIYVVLTIAIAPLSYMNIQCRISEIMVLLAFINPSYIIGLTLGCFIANTLGPNGLTDIIFGTLATFLSVSAIAVTGNFIKNKARGIFIASLWPTIFNGLIIGTMLHYILNIPLALSIFQVAIGEFFIVTIIGVPLFKFFTKKYGKYYDKLSI
ncbi:QueT transporter family protein [Clostridium fallax]|uniref:Uncharacterized membrane protein n=1 Tax=Clostridium fallax TaxID=1533 RepID=A0A1M4XUW4_9CLOT|nr:QueT transporter family protein [Clostridium fallax]SHE97042.1 Uncharacterized membrane protein [Clostridium fallax]SQB06534.1 citrulline cluster-linked gene [Clostridium fallax]